MRRFFISSPVAECMMISGRDAHHIAHVLRYQPGDCLIVVDNAQNIAEAKIISLENESVTLSLVKRLAQNTEAPIEVMLAQCLPKADKMDFIVQKVVELGISAIYPIASENCVVKYDAAKREARRQKWQKIAHEAAKQCGRTIVPEVAQIVDLDSFLAALPEKTEILLCYEQEDDFTLKSLLAGSTAGRYLIIIGPEGGFSPSEADLCRAHGCSSVTLGPRILRTETAAVAAVSIVMYQNGDLGGRG